MHNMKMTTNGYDNKWYDFQKLKN